MRMVRMRLAWACLVGLVLVGLALVPAAPLALSQAAEVYDVAPGCRNPALNSAARTQIALLAALHNSADGDPGFSAQLLAGLRIDAGDECAAATLEGIEGGRLQGAAALPLSVGEGQDEQQVVLDPGPDGLRTLRLRVRNAAGASAVLTASIVLDRVPPQLLAGAFVTPPATMPITTPLIALSLRDLRASDAATSGGFWGLRLATVLTPSLSDDDPAISWHAIPTLGAPASVDLPAWNLAADARPVPGQQIELRAQLLDAAGNPSPQTLRLPLTLAADFSAASSATPQAEASPQAASQTAGYPFFGSNLYLGGLERSGRDDREALADLAWQGGARWSREEITWAEVQRYRSRYLNLYDTPFRSLARRGFGITGMLVTTPLWARNPRCKDSSYYCPPVGVNDFAAFANWMAERYDGDGYLDARDSPRVATWEIWNEPNFQETWPGTPAEYGALLVAGYQAIKAADPSATVLLGGVYVFDGSNDGLAFLDRVFAAVPAAARSFDAISIHPYLPTVAPDDPGTLRLVTLEGRLRSTIARANAWARRYGGAPRPIWVTELGWCTASAYCTGVEALSQDRQATYLVRSIGLLKALGVARLDWFQFEDKFDGGSKLKWGDMAIVGTRAQGYAPKAAYYAYRSAEQLLGDATFVGYGPLQTHAYDAARPYNKDGGGRYHLVFRQANGGRIDMLWQAAGSSSAQLRLDVPAQRVSLIDRDGGLATPTLRGNSIALTLSERPIFVRQDAAPILDAPQTLLFLFKPGETALQQQAIMVRNLGGSSFSWSLSGSPAWLTANPGSAAAPASSQLLVNPALLPAGESDAVLTLAAQPEGGSRLIQVRAIVAPNVQRQRLPLINR